MAEESVSLRDVMQAVGRLEERVQDLSLSMARMEERVQGLEKRLEEGFSFVRMNLDQVDKRIDESGASMRLALEQVHRRIDDVQGEVRSLRTWIIAMYAPIVAGVVAVLVAYARSLW